MTTTTTTTTEPAAGKFLDRATAIDRRNRRLARSRGNHDLAGVLTAIEDLRVQQMTRSAAGTSDRPGKCVKRKRGLNRTILRQGWALARRMLEYKGARRGVRVVAVEAAFTSQTCAACGHVDRVDSAERAVRRLEVVAFSNLQVLSREAVPVDRTFLCAAAGAVYELEAGDGATLFEQLFVR